MKSTPRVTPYSLSPFRCFRFRDDGGGGGGEDRFRFCKVDVDDFEASRCVDVTTKVLVTETHG